MTWFFAAVAAQFILGSSVVADKLLLKKSYPNPIGYTFWLGILGLASIALFPFGFHLISGKLMLLALLAGGIFVTAILFFFLALFAGEASNTATLIGALSPVFTLFASSIILGVSLNTLQFAAFGMLMAGGFLLFSTQQKDLRFKILFFAAMSASLFGLTHAITKDVFLQTNFVTGFIWIKIGGALTALLFLLHRRARSGILNPADRDQFRNRLGYLLNRGWAGIGSLTLYFALSLGSPPLVNAIGNLQYIFIFLGGWLILKERFRGWALAGKILAFLVISCGIVLLGAYDYFRTNAPSPNRPISWGLTFSEKFSEALGLDWRENYNAILNDLGVKRLRLVSYWDLVEPREGQFDFTNLDYQINLAAERGAKIILTVGRKVPRWPECHEPNWIKDQAAGVKNEKLLEYMKAVIERYKNNPALEMWQVENEPFLRFGECPPLDTKLLDKEIALVKSLDANHSVLITDSGELSLWFLAAKRGDVFGTTMYRRVHNRVFGSIDYHLPPEFFRLKEKFSRFMTNDASKKYIVVELGAEPWLLHQLYETKIEDQLKVFDPPYFKDTIGYAKSAGFNEYYLWGAEWWYWMKTKHNMPEFWDYATIILRN